MWETENTLTHPLASKSWTPFLQWSPWNFLWCMRVKFIWVWCHMPSTWSSGHPCGTCIVCPMTMYLVRVALRRLSLGSAYHSFADHLIYAASKKTSMLAMLQISRTSVLGILFCWWTLKMCHRHLMKLIQFGNVLAIRRHHVSHL